MDVYINKRKHETFHDVDHSCFTTGLLGQIKARSQSTIGGDTLELYNDADKRRLKMNKTKINTSFIHESKILKRKFAGGHSISIAGMHGRWF
jgi:hypothetical protein